MEPETIATVRLKNSKEQNFSDHDELNIFLCDYDKSEIDKIEWY
jgi:hypothetical protein